MHVTRGQSDDGTLCGLGFPFQITQGTGGGASGYLVTGILESKWKRYSVPFPGPFLMMNNIELPFLGYSLSCLL